MPCGRSWVLSSDGRLEGWKVGREGQTFSGDSLLVRYVNFVKLPHTLFALPFALLGVILAAAIFWWAAWALNPLCFALAPLALAWIAGYSYTKRFTHWSHLWLGFSLAIAP